jgi:Tol biopolymer transport system component
MSIRPLAALLAALLATSAIAAPAEHASRVLTGNDLFNLEAASDPQISPDGKTVVYVRRTNDIMTDRARSSIWSIDVATGMQTPLVAGAGSHGQPRWSPDGSRLAYISNDDEKAGAQLYVRWMKTGATARITGLANSPHGIAWSPDGTRIAWSAFVPDDSAHLGKAPDKPEGAKWAEPLQVIDKVVYRTDEGGYEKPGFEQIFWVSAEGGAPIQLTFGAHDAGGKLAWTRDGRAIVFSANLTADAQRDIVDNEVHEVALDTREVRTLTQRKGPTTRLRYRRTGNGSPTSVSTTSTSAIRTSSCRS